MLTASIIIPTYNRPDDLKKCIESILVQTVIPYEVIVVDDGNLDRLPFEEECRKSGIKYIYHKKKIRGLTASRNSGIKLATGDIIFFLDDDVILFPDYVEEILRVYEGDQKEIVGGVGGEIANPKPITSVQKIRRIFNIIFLVSGFHEGKVLPSGFCTNYGTTGSPIHEWTEVDFLSGGVCSFRKQVFQDFSFDSEMFRNYAMGEDKEFSYRVANKYKLIYTPKARLLHMESPKMSPDNFKEGQMFINFTYIFFIKYVKKSIFNWLLFYYALLGYTLSRTIILILSPKKGNFDRVRGVIKGINDCVFRKNAVVE
ncbi:MAG: glycosyltransferase family 2 protein [Nitrospirae bacterium]|nr:glycosyltransferase family 2 protein [Nitrospirota bacterium]